MKKRILIVSIAAALVSAFGAVIAQSPTPTPTASPIPLPSPTTVSVAQPMQIILSAARLQALVTAISPVVTLPPGIVSLNLRVLTSGTNAGGAFVQLQFH